MRRDRHGQSRRRADQSLPDPVGKLFEVRGQARCLYLVKNLDEPQHRAQQAEQRGQLRNRREQIQLLFQPRHFRRTRFFQRFAHPLPAVVAVQDGGLDQPRDGAGGGVANGQRLDHVIALEDGAHAVEKLGRVNLRAMTMQKPLNEGRHGHGADEQEQP